MSDRVLWPLLSVGATTLAGLAARELLKRSWRTSMNEDPPINPAAPTTTWSDALLWTASTGLVIGVVRLLAKRGVAQLWQDSKGYMPREA